MSDTRTVREAIARAIADTGEDPENALVEADAVLAALTEAGIVLCRELPPKALYATSASGAIIYVPLTDDEIGRSR